MFLKSNFKSTSMKTYCNLLFLKELVLTADPFNGAVVFLHIDELKYVADRWRILPFTGGW